MTTAAEPAIRRVRVAILNHNGGDLVVDAVASVLALDWDQSIEVLVIDNNSADDSVDRLRSRFGDRVTLVERPDNVGFSANNVAFEGLDRVDAVALVNPDATVERGWLRALAAALDEDAGLGAAVPRMLLASRYADVAIECDAPVLLDGEPGVGVHVRLRHGGRLIRRVIDQDAPAHGVVTLGLPVDPNMPDMNTPAALVLRSDRPARVRVGGHEPFTLDGERVVQIPIDGPANAIVNNAGGRWLPAGFAADRGLGEVDGGRFDTPTEVFSFSGGGVLLRSSFLADVGGFDPTYFLYYEDTDLSCRGRARGWRYRYVPSAVMHHAHGAVVAQGGDEFSHHSDRSRMIFLAAHAPLALALRSWLALAKATAVESISMACYGGHVGRRRALALLRARARVLGGSVRPGVRMLLRRRRAGAPTTLPAWSER